MVKEFPFGLSHRDYVLAKRDPVSARWFLGRCGQSNSIQVVVFKTLELDWVDIGFFIFDLPCGRVHSDGPFQSNKSSFLVPTRELWERKFLLSHLYLWTEFRWLTSSQNSFEKTHFIEDVRFKHLHTVQEVEWAWSTYDLRRHSSDLARHKHIWHSSPQQQMQALFISQIPRPSTYSQMIMSFPEWKIFIWYLLFTNFTACKSFKKLSFKWIEKITLAHQEMRHIWIMHLTVLTTSARESCVQETWRWKGLIQLQSLGKAHFGVGAPRIRVDRGMRYLTGGTSMQFQQIHFETEIDIITLTIQSTLKTDYSCQEPIFLA